MKTPFLLKPVALSFVMSFCGVWQQERGVSQKWNKMWDNISIHSTSGELRVNKHKASWGPHSTPQYNHVDFIYKF